MKYSLRKGIDLSDELLKKIETEQNRMSAKQAAFKFASYKPRTCKQVEDKLREKYDYEIIEDTIAFLEEFDLLDDRKYAEMFIKDFIERKPSGKPRLRQELFRKGVSSVIVEETLEKLFPEEESINLARRAAEKKLRAVSYKPLEKQKSSLVSYLQRQGFSYEVIKAVLEENFESPYFK